MHIADDSDLIEVNLWKMKHNLKPLDSLFKNSFELLQVFYNNVGARFDPWTRVFKPTSSMHAPADSLGR